MCEWERLWNSQLMLSNKGRKFRFSGFNYHLCVMFCKNFILRFFFFYKKKFLLFINFYLCFIFIIISYNHNLPFVSRLIVRMWYKKEECNWIVRQNVINRIDYYFIALCYCLIIIIIPKLLILIGCFIKVSNQSSVKLVQQVAILPIVTRTNFQQMNQWKYEIIKLIKI